MRSAARRERSATVTTASASYRLIGDNAVQDVLDALIRPNSLLYLTDDQGRRVYVPAWAVTAVTMHHVGRQP